MFGEVFDLSRPFTSTFTTRNKMQAVLDFPFQDAARSFASEGTPTSQLGTFFRNDDWYTDADSNVYQLPTFLGNHDMGRIGFFVNEDNPGASEDEPRPGPARPRADVLLRGNPVIYYGDEQGFTGTGGDQRLGRRCSPARSPTTWTTICSAPTAPMRRTTSIRPSAVRAHSANLAASPRPSGTAQRRPPDRYASDEAGIYAFSRLHRGQQREYVVALNNSESEKTASVPTYVRNGSFVKVRVRLQQLTSSGNRRLTVTVPALSAVVYQSTQRIPRSESAPQISLDNPTISTETNSRMLVSANVGGSSFNEVTFYAKVGSGAWKSTAPTTRGRTGCSTTSARSQTARR